MVAVIFLDLREGLKQFADTRPALLSWVLFMPIFHIVAFLFEQLDRRNLFVKHKHFRPTPYTPAYTRMLPRVISNQVFLLLPAMLLLEYLGLLFPPHRDPPPTTLASLVAMATIGPVLHEASFYLGHRYILHHPRLFRTLNHTLHHASLAHSAVSAMYMSPPDFVLEIILPALLPLAVLSSRNLSTPLHCMMLLPLGSIGGMYEHSGYNFFAGFAPVDTTVHGLHHLYGNCSFADGVGAPGLFDAAMGTVCGSVGAVSAPVRAALAWLAGDGSEGNEDGKEVHRAHEVRAR